jgi:hypothetical protein
LSYSISLFSVKGVLEIRSHKTVCLGWF